MNKTRRFLLSLVLGCSALLSWAQPAGPDALVKQLSADVIESVKSDKAIQAGDIQRVISLVDTKVMPHVDAERMTASAMGRYWRQATTDQQRGLQEQFKLLLVRTYAGALSQVTEQTMVHIKPLRAASDTEAVVRTEVRGRGEPLQLDYRLEKAGAEWKINDVNVAGVWLAENYRNSFAQEISSSGIDGLLVKLSERNKAARSK